MNTDTPETEAVKDFSQPEKLYWLCQKLERQRNEYRVLANRYGFLKTKVETTRKHDGHISKFTLDWSPDNDPPTLGVAIDWDLEYLEM